MATTYTAIGFPSRADILFSYPLIKCPDLLPPGSVEIEAGILIEGRSILGNVSSYKAALTLVNAWRRQDKMRRTLIIAIR